MGIDKQLVKKGNIKTKLLDFSFLKVFNINCYNLKLGSGCNLGKDLSKSEGDNQLVKHKDT